MHRFTKHPFGAKVISLLLAASLALGVPLTALAEEIAPAPTEPAAATEPRLSDPIVPPNLQDEFEAQLAAGERVRLALASEPQMYGLRVASERDAQYEALAQACMDAFAAGQTEVPLAAYGEITPDEFETLKNTMRCLPGGEKASELEFKFREEGETKIPVCYEVTYLTDEEQADIEAAITYFCSFAAQGETDFEKILLVHDALVLNTEYSVVAFLLQEDKLINAPKVVYDPYGILVDRKGVCQSYAYAFQILMNRLGIPSIYVSSAKLNHAWNAVQLDGKWYHVDETWDDGASPDVLGRALHKNFLKSTSNFDVSHCPEGEPSPYSPDDFIGLDHLTNVLTSDTGTEYDTFWWNSVQSGILPIVTDGEKNWYYLNKDGALCSRDSANLLKNEDATVSEYGGFFTQITVQGDRLYCTDGDTITPYSFSKDELGNMVMTPAESLQTPNYGIACMDDKIYYAETQYPEERAPYLDYVRTVKDLDGNPLPLPPEPGLLVTEEDFPDEAFRNYVLTYFDTDRNGYLSRSQRETVDIVDVTGKGIADLTGLALFPNMEYLQCGHNKLTTLDVTGYEKLTVLTCDHNEMTELKFRPTIEWLLCDNNRLTELDVSAAAALNTLECGNNQLRTLDVSENTKLEQLSCTGNQLTELALGANPLLKLLRCEDNNIATLDLSANPALADGEDNKIDPQTLNLNATLEGDEWTVSLLELPGFDAAKASVESGAGGYPRYENGKVRLCRKDDTPGESFSYSYATGAAAERFNRMEVTAMVSHQPLPAPTPKPTPAPPTATPAPATATPAPATATAAPETVSHASAGTTAQASATTLTPAPADNTRYFVCEACGYHSWTPYLDGYQCTHCGHLRGTTGVAAPAAAQAGKVSAASAIPATGDAESPALAVVVLLLSCFGLGYGVCQKKKSGR